MVRLVVLNCFVCVVFTLHLPSTVILGLSNTTGLISLNATGELHGSPTGELYVFLGKVDCHLFLVGQRAETDALRPSRNSTYFISIPAMI